MGIETVYIFCFVVGAVYALIAGVAAGVFGGHTHHAGFTGHDLGHDIHHSADPSHLTAQGEVHLSPISPVTITMFVTAFGGIGLTATHALTLPIVLSLPTALASGVILAGAAFYTFSKLFQATESSSEARVSELVGLEAEVITPIPSQGLGEIGYVARGTRFTAPARSDDGKPHPAHSMVVIERTVGSVFCVKKSLDERFRDLVLGEDQVKGSLSAEAEPGTR
jgi:membrane protein implicated in regulation of membrane protease activity